MRAAESLHLSQPTLSTQIKNMEEELGKQLLIRGTKGSRKVTLTEEGMILRKRAEEILELVEKTEREISVADDIIVGQEDKGGNITQWLKRKSSDLNIVATYNLIFNASLMVEEGLGYAVTFD